MKKIVFIVLLVLTLVFAFTVILISKGFIQEKTQKKGTVGGVIPWSEKLKGQFCKDKKTGVEINYQEAIEIAQKNKCGIQRETLVAFSTNYLCNEDTGTWWVDLLLTPEKTGCNPACVVDIVDKTAEVNWRCTGTVRR